MKMLKSMISIRITIKPLLARFRNWQYQRRLAWCKENDVLHYALVEAGQVEDVLRWSKSKLLWMRDVDRYMARDESRIQRAVDKRVAAAIRELGKKR